MRFYEVKQMVGHPETGAPVVQRRSFQPTNGAAKRLGRDWNNGHRLTPASGITVELCEVNGGKHGMLSFMNEIVGFKYLKPGEKPAPKEPIIMKGVKSKKVKPVKKKVTKKKKK